MGPMTGDWSLQPSTGVSPFDRASFDGTEPFTRIGGGSVGSKARGLLRVADILATAVRPRFRDQISVEIPRFSVIGADCFDVFVGQNGLSRAALRELTDEQIAAEFEGARLPDAVQDDLQVLVSRLRVPLAIRSSSLLEDDVHEPMAGAYATMMLPNSAPDPARRLDQVVRAVKRVYASMFLREATRFARAGGRPAGDEKMAVIIQDVTGTGQNGRFYPHLSGVARSSNFYPLGIAKPGDGSASLALGLGRTIMAEGVGWSFSPACPQANPPYNTRQELLKMTQTRFWAIDLEGTAHEGRQAASVSETEYLGNYALAEAEADGALALLASTYDPDNDRIVTGLSGSGPRLVDFAPILKANCTPLNALIKELLRACEDTLKCPVEIEFAASFPPHAPCPARFGFLQVRPLMASHAEVDVLQDELLADNVLVASDAALGNGNPGGVLDVVYVKPSSFDPKRTRDIAMHLDAINQAAAGRPYVLIGFGRWGSSDPYAGIPVRFGQIAGAKVIVESTLPSVDYWSSQGTHFFHNLTRLEVLYFSVHHRGNPRIDWEWLDRQDASRETEFVRHIQLAAPLDIRVDGRTSRGVIIHP